MADDGQGEEIDFVHEQRLSPRRLCSQLATLPSNSLQVFIIQPSRDCFGNREEESSSSTGTVFNCVSSYLRSLFRRVAHIRAASRTALHAELRSLTRLPAAHQASHQLASSVRSRALSSSLREHHTWPQILLSVNTSTAPSRHRLQCTWVMSCKVLVRILIVLYCVCIIIAGNIGGVLIWRIFWKPPNLMPRQ